MTHLQLRCCMYRKFRTTFSLWVAFALLPSLCFGQSDKTFENLGLSTMSDSAIHEFVAFAKLDNLIAKKDEMLGLMQQIKRLSMESRLKNAQMVLNDTSIALRKRAAELDKQSELLLDLDKRTQENSPVFVLSRASAEQLLISAQLELQKINWDLASEETLLEDSAIEAESKAKERSIELEVARFEVNVLRSDIEVAQQDFVIAEDLHQRKALGLVEFEKAKRSLQKAKSALEMQQLRIALLMAQQEAVRNSQVAGIKSQIRKLKARKDQVEKYIKDLLESTNSLSRREQLEGRIVHLQKEFDQAARLRNDSEIKVEEIERLLNTLNEVQLAQKKE